MFEAIQDSELTQPFVIIDGGVVQNIPTIPVFDLDVLDSDYFDEATIDETVELNNQMVAFVKEHPEYEDWFKSHISDAQGWLYNFAPDRKYDTLPEN